jgi:hypothetical protein
MGAGEWSWGWDQEWGWERECGGGGVVGGSGWSLVVGGGFSAYVVAFQEESVKAKAAGDDEAVQTSVFFNIRCLQSTEACGKLYAQWVSRASAQKGVDAFLQQWNSLQCFIAEDPVVKFDCPYLYMSYLEAQAISRNPCPSFVTDLLVDNLMSMLHVSGEKARFWQTHFVAMMVSNALTGADARQILLAGLLPFKDQLTQSDDDEAAQVSFILSNEIAGCILLLTRPDIDAPTTTFDTLAAMVKRTSADDAGPLLKLFRRSGAAQAILEDNQKVVHDAVVAAVMFGNFDRIQTQLQQLQATPAGAGSLLEFLGEMKYIMHWFQKLPPTELKWLEDRRDLDSFRNTVLKLAEQMSALVLSRWCKHYASKDCDTTSAPEPSYIRPSHASIQT